MGYASRDLKPLSEIAIIDQETIDAIAAQVPSGGLTIEQIKADTSIADAITKKHSNASDHSNSNDHAARSDDQDLSTLQPKETGKGLSATDLTSVLKTSYDGAVTHAGSTHAPAGAQANADITKAEIEAKLTGEISSHTHAGGGAGMNLLKTTANQTINSGAATFVDITGLTFPVTNGVSYAFYFYITFQSAATTTGFKTAVNCPTGALDFWCQAQTIANGAAGVATHTERHNTVRDDMTLLTATISANVDLTARIEGRYLCTQNGTFAARFANELASNTQLVIQKGSYGYWF